MEGVHTEQTARWAITASMRDSSSDTRGAAACDRHPAQRASGGRSDEKDGLSGASTPIGVQHNRARARAYTRNRRASGVGFGELSCVHRAVPGRESLHAGLRSADGDRPAFCIFKKKN